MWALARAELLLLLLLLVVVVWFGCVDRRVSSTSLQILPSVFTYFTGRTRLWTRTDCSSRNSCRTERRPNWLGFLWRATAGSGSSARYRRLRAATRTWIRTGPDWWPSVGRFGPPAHSFWDEQERERQRERAGMRVTGQREIRRTSERGETCCAPVASRESSM